MDQEGEPRKSRWDWLPAQMPGVVKLMAERRAKVGAAWVNECWQRGVLKGEPGWFFAAEGPLMVGTLTDDPQMVAFATAKVTRTQALLVMKERPADGTN